MSSSSAPHSVFLRCHCSNSPVRFEDISGGCNPRAPCLAPPPPKVVFTLRWSSPDMLLKEKQQRPGIQLPSLAGPIQLIWWGGSWACDRVNGLCMEGSAPCDPSQGCWQGAIVLHFFISLGIYLFFLQMIIHLIIWIIIII